MNDPDEKCDAVIVYSKTVQNNYGASGDLTWFSTLGSHLLQHNQFTVGSGFDGGHINYTQNTQYGYLTPDYRIVGVNAWQDGSTVIDSRVGLHGLTPDWSVFLTDTLSGSYNRSRVNNSDLINPVAGPGSLDGDYVFQRFNPSIW